MSETDRIYAVCIAGVDYTSAAEHSIIVIMKLSDVTIKLKLLTVLENLINTFNQKETNILLLYNKKIIMQAPS